MQNFSFMPMGAGTIIDRAFRIYRRNFASIVLFSTLIGGSAALLLSLLRMGPAAFSSTSLTNILMGAINGDIDSVLESYYTATQAVSTASTIGNVLSFPLGLLTTVLLTPLVTGGISLIAVSAFFGQSASPKEYLGRTKPFYGKLVATSLAQILVSILGVIVIVIPLLITTLVVIISDVASGAIIALIIIMAVATILAACLLTCFLTLVYPVVVHENRTGFGAVGRAWKLFRRKIWKTLGVSILAWGIVIALSTVLETLAMFLPMFFATVLSTVISTLLTPISIIVSVLLYLDIRMTTEGYDLELRAQQQQSGQTSTDLEE